jgi:hypothetical protein
MKQQQQQPQQDSTFQQERCIRNPKILLLRGAIE